MPSNDPPAPPTWTAWLDTLRSFPASIDADDWLDERLEDLAEASGAAMETAPGSAPSGSSVPSGDPTGFWLAALDRARSESTRRDVAWRLATTGRVGDLEVADALSAAFAQEREHLSLGPALLAALAERAARDPAAVPDLLRVLLRLREDAPRYLAIQAAKVIGRFEGRGVATQARARLDAWAQADDLAVQGEARQQLALLALGTALGQPDGPHLLAALLDCQPAFARAEASEELRHDARLVRGILDLLVTHLAAPTDPGTYDATIAPKARALKQLLNDPRERPWPGYASGAERVLEYRAYRVAAGFERLASDVAGMGEWTNFDAALTELAAIWQLMWGRAIGVTRSGFGEADEGGAAFVVADEAAMARRAASVALPRVGSFLEAAVGRQRLLRVVEHAEAARGPDDERARILRAFYAAAARAPAEPSGDRALAVDRDALVRLANTLPATALHVLRVVPGVEAMLREAGLEPSAAGETLQAYRVPIDFPACFGDDPAVDETVRRVLDASWVRLAPGYPPERLQRFVALTVRIVQVARDLRSDLPPFLLRAEETDGKGQQASEDDLQRYVFEVLRREYSRNYVHWEATRMAGGRSDVGVFFPEGGFPIEVKAEYRDISRQHIRTAYLTQPDRYATDRDRVSYLLVLDLRATLAVPETALYSLRDSFWVDGLPSDPQITDPQQNAVVVGLFPGNQPKPSSTTTYSRRPVARTSTAARTTRAPRSPSPARDAGGEDDTAESSRRQLDDRGAVGQDGQ